MPWQRTVSSAYCQDSLLIYDKNWMWNIVKPTTKKRWFYSYCQDMRAKKYRFHSISTKLMMLTENTGLYWLLQLVTYIYALCVHMNDVRCCSAYNETVKRWLCNICHIIIVVGLVEICKKKTIYCTFEKETWKNSDWKTMEKDGKRRNSG